MSAVGFIVCCVSYMYIFSRDDTIPMHRAHRTWALCTVLGRVGRFLCSSDTHTYKRAHTHTRMHTHFSIVSHYHPSSSSTFVVWCSSLLSVLYMLNKIVYVMLYRLCVHLLEAKHHTYWIGSSRLRISPSPKIRTHSFQSNLELDQSSFTCVMLC